MQNATMTYIVHKGIYWGHFLSFFAKIIFQQKMYCLHSDYMDDRRHGHYILTYMVQGQ